MNKKKVLGASLGNCVHVAGVINFLRLAEVVGYEPVFLGPAVPITNLIQAIKKHNPHIIGLSYRLGPQAAKNLFCDLKAQLTQHNLLNKTYMFGGTPPVGEVAAQTGIFKVIFTGRESMEETIAALKGGVVRRELGQFGATLLERIDKKHPYPLLRHHLGLASVDETVEAAKEVAEAKVLDVVSIAPDQNAQVSFFRPDELDPKLDGAGGVPLRRPKDLCAIYEATRCGNYPLLRCYSGTRDLIKWAEMSVETIKIAWGAIPLCWYNRLDGRSPRMPLESITENQAAIRWYGKRSIPVEINESHHWSLRDAHDTIAVTMAYLAAYNAKVLGVKHYVAQYMFNTPPTTSPSMDLAKMLAKIELIEGLHDDNFRSFRQVRAGLAGLAVDMDLAKGQLAASTSLSMAVSPHIVHVVGYCEGDHAAEAAEIIESCKIVRGVINNCLFGLPKMDADLAVQNRKEQLIQEAKLLIEAIRLLGENKYEDSLVAPANLALAIKIGLLDTPHLKGNPFAKGEVTTQFIDGAWYAVEPTTKRKLREGERIQKVLENAKDELPAALIAKIEDIL